MMLSIANRDLTPLLSKDNLASSEPAPDANRSYPSARPLPLKLSGDYSSPLCASFHHQPRPRHTQASGDCGTVLCVVFPMWWRFSLFHSRGLFHLRLSLEAWPHHSNPSQFMAYSHPARPPALCFSLSYVIAVARQASAVHLSLLATVLLGFKTFGRGRGELTTGSRFCSHACCAPVDSIPDDLSDKIRLSACKCCLSLLPRFPNLGRSRITPHGAVISLYFG